MQLVIELKNRGASLPLGSTYLDALVTYSESVAKDSKESSSKRILGCSLRLAGH